MSTDYCGVVEHDDDCLCDVVIPHPTGWVSDAVQNMWMGEEIVALMGYTIEWTPSSIVKYLGDLTYAKDNWDKFNLEQPVFRGTGKTTAIRRELRKRLHSGQRILDAAREMNLSHHELMTTLFTNRREMDYETLAQFEEDVIQRKFTNAGTLGRKYGLRHRSSTKLHEYWGVPFGVKVEPQDPVSVMIDELLMTQPELKNKKISQMVAEHFGLEERPSSDKIRMRRHYLARCKRQ